MQTSDLGGGETSVLPSDPVILIARAIKFCFSNSVEFSKVEESKVLKLDTSFASTTLGILPTSVGEWGSAKET